jgi:hypothetical protein
LPGRSIENKVSITYYFSSEGFEDRSEKEHPAENQQLKSKFPGEEKEG